MSYSVKFSGIIIATLGITAVFMQCTGTHKTANNGDPGQIIFFDDFSGDSLDRAKWNVLETGPVFNDEQQAYIDSPATIYLVKGKESEGAINGALVIHPRFAPGFVTKDGKKFDFISGRLHTKNKVEFTHGTAAARIKLTEGKGLWPAWWLLGNGNWPQSGEIDIMEFVGEREWVNAAIHGPGYSGNTPFVKRDSSMMVDPVTNWHIYAVDWTPDRLVFTIDGRAFYTVTKSMIEQYGKWAFDSPEYLVLNFAIGGGYPGGVNKIKLPYHGVPQSTVDLVKANKVKLLVDWVRVTKNR